MTDPACRLCNGVRFVIDAGNGETRPAYSYEHPGLYRYQCPMCNPVTDPTTRTPATFEEWRKFALADGLLGSFTPINAWNAATAARDAAVAAELEREADLYQLADGEPGRLGNHWGWRQIARTYRDLAAKFRGGPAT